MGVAIWACNSSAGMGWRQADPWGPPVNHLAKEPYSASVKDQSQNVRSKGVVIMMAKPTETANQS